MKVYSSKRVYAAEDKDSQVSDMISDLKDDFDFILSGLDRLDRQGANGRNDAMMLGENLSSSLEQHINELSSRLGGSE